MRHVRIDNELTNDKREFACGIVLPEGDTWIFPNEIGLMHTVDCPECNPNQKPLGTPISELSGRPGHSGYDKFCQIAESWGY